MRLNHGAGRPRVVVGLEKSFQGGWSEKRETWGRKEAGEGGAPKAVEKKKWNADHENGGRWTLPMVWNARLKVG